jgi:hypothetical protein
VSSENGIRLGEFESGREGIDHGNNVGAVITIGQEDLSGTGISRGLSQSVSVLGVTNQQCYRRPEGLGCPEQFVRTGGETAVGRDVEENEDVVGHGVRPKSADSF